MTNEDRRTFAYEFVDESQQRRITLDFGDSDDEVLRFGSADGEFYLNANKAGFLALAKVFLKLSMSAYSPGFHLHLGEDFSDPNEPKRISIALIDDVL